MFVQLQTLDEGISKQSGPQAELRMALREPEQTHPDPHIKGQLTTPAR